MSEKNHTTKSTETRKKIRAKTIIFDTDFLDDPKVLQLTGQFGAAGLGMFLRLLTALGREGGHASVTAVSHLGLAIGVSRDEFNAFVRACVDLELVIEADGHIVSPRLVSDATQLDQKRKSWRERQKVSRVSHASVTEMSEEEPEQETEPEPEKELEPESSSIGGAGGAESKPPKPKRASKLYGHREGTQLYGEFNRVWLTGEEYQRLCSEHGAERVNRKLQSLDASIENGNRKYRAFENHYATLSNWFRLDAEKNKPRAGPRLSDFDLAAKRELERGVKKGLVSQEEFNKWCAERSI